MRRTLENGLSRDSEPESEKFAVDVNKLYSMKASSIFSMFGREGSIASGSQDVAVINLTRLYIETIVA
jgi:hypothetical protein